MTNFLVSLTLFSVIFKMYTPVLNDEMFNSLLVNTVENICFPKTL